ncbi:MAG: hypothetical protein IPP74_07280 [Alphaproteobacteria bacterium]|nr:hypothetical protein [Alphaproteobacteria bacterium]
MGLTLTLTDHEIPASPAFIEFLHATLTGTDYHAGEWYAQEEEGLATNDGRFGDIQEKAKFVLSNEVGKKLVVRSYRFFKEMLTGRPETIKSISRFRFIFIVGIPRTGGTYLTKQLFRAAQIDYKKVQNALAHDGFPHLATLEFKNKANVHTHGLLQLAEYLTMVEMYYTKYGKLAYKGGIVVPKKFTKVVYNYPLIQELCEANSEYIITLRHPLGMIGSVLEKSGGMPENKKFIIRSAIERWAYDDWIHWGEDEKVVQDMEYIDVLLGYWKRFHFKMALEGIPRHAGVMLVPFGKEPMEHAVKTLFQNFNLDLEPEPFKVGEIHSFDNAIKAKAERVVNDVTHFWDSLGLTFPAEELVL